MVWFMMLKVVSTLVELVRRRRKSESEKGLEILLLRWQLATKLKARTGRTIQQMREAIRIVKPVRGKKTYPPFRPHRVRKYYPASNLSQFVLQRMINWTKAAVSPLVSNAVLEGDRENC